MALAALGLLLHGARAGTAGLVVVTGAVLVLFGSNAPGLLVVAAGGLIGSLLSVLVGEEGFTRICESRRQTTSRRLGPDPADAVLRKALGDDPRPSRRAGVSAAPGAEPAVEPGHAMMNVAA